MSKPENFIFIRSHYGHWARRSGYGLLVEYLQRDHGISVDEMVTAYPADGADSSPGQPVRPELPWYTSADQISECRVAQMLATKSSAIVHFLDGERGLQFTRPTRAKRHHFVAATFHQPPEVLKRRGLMGYKRQLAALDRLVIVSENQRAFFESYVRPERIRCIPHGIDTAYYRPPQCRTPVPGRLRCLTVGFWQRDLAAVLHAARVLEDNPQITFELVGAGAGLKNGGLSTPLYDRLRCQPNLTLRDGIADAELLELYQNSDLLLLPLTDATANNALLEALSCGLPIVTTDLPATRYYLDDSCAAFVPQGDLISLENQLRALVPQTGPRQRMPAAARQLACNVYDWHGIAEHYMDMYEDMTHEDKLHHRPLNDVKNAMCTIVTSDYLSLALTLHKSIVKHGQCDFYIVIADDHFEESRFRMVKEALKGQVKLVKASELPRRIRVYENEDSLRWSLKPTTMLHLLKDRGYHRVICVDSDVCFFHDYDFLFGRLSEASMLLTPHWRPLDPAVNETQFINNFTHGLYNAGFVGCSRGGIPALEWWEMVCQYRCDKAESQGFFVDQRYLDMVPVHFDNVAVMDHKGCNVAEWNRDHLPRVTLAEGVHVGHQPLVFIHFTAITIDGIERGVDPHLAPCLETYRQYADEAEKQILVQDLGLCPDQAPGSTIVQGADIALKADGPALCAVVDYLTAPNLLLQLTSLRRSHDRLPDYHVLCADFASYQWLKELAIDEFTLTHWSALASYRLEKIRQTFEGQHYHEGDQQRFSHCCRPFFLKHLLFTRGCRQVVEFDPKLLFYGDKFIDINALASASECRVMPTDRHHYAALSVAATEGAALLLGLWENRVTKHGPSLPDADGLTGPTPSGCGWKRFDQLIRRSRQLSAGKTVGEHRAESLPGESSGLIIYDNTTLLLKDGRLIIPPTSSVRQDPPLLAEVRQLATEMGRTYPVVSNATVDPAFERIPLSDIIQMAAKRGVDINNVAAQFNETWEGDMSQAMKAYLLYLAAVRYKESGDGRKARELLDAIDGSKVLISDLYRSKTAYHLADLDEQDGRMDDALNHYARCLKFTASNKVAEQRISALKKVNAN